MLAQLRRFAEQKLEQCKDNKNLLERLCLKYECFGAFNFAIIQTHSPDIIDLWDEFAPKFDELL